MSSGRRAALPPMAYRLPARFDDRGDHPLRLTVFPEHGRSAVEFDFAALPVSDVMRRWFLERFALATGPSGSYRTERSARSLMSAVRSFAAYLGSLDHPPDAPNGLRGAHWDGWVLTLSPGTRKSFYGAMRTLSRGCEDIPGEFFARAARTRAPERSVKLPSYTPDEFKRITAVAKSDVREAVQRVRRGRALLVEWRAGDVDRTDDPHRWEHGALLDHIDRHDQIPRYPSGRNVKRVAQHGGSAVLFGQLYPTVWDVSAAAVLLVCLTGHNLSPVLSLPAEAHRPDGDSGGTKTALVDMLKPRRGRNRAHMNVALTDVGGQADGRTDVSSAFGVYELVRELTAPVRARSGSELLFGYLGIKQGLAFRPELRETAVSRRARSQQVVADAPSTSDGEAGVLSIDTRRLRMTWLQVHERPVAHTEQTLANDYLARNRGNLAEYQKVVADTLEEQVTTAREQVHMRTITIEQADRAAREPEVVAAEVDLAPTVLTDLIAGSLDTVLGGCTDFRGGPHAAPGQPCAASFLMCLSCPCARATPAHLPVIVAVHDRLHDKANEMTPLQWAQRFAGPVAQLTDIMHRYPTIAVDDARAHIGPEQQDLVERFLSRSLDVQ
ncbi:hypothetical protein [Mycolicibacterium mucogenicum]|uniref:Uncharacterized protein n=1 Tax=Mycolicibacterium mucogenicum TaxID=56689 RepID=A0A4R5WMT4_MYCMU|nr:hypothetical protein [Mycolicibacterium mucogenicum]TDK92556.1 hypothetical protein EUA03_05425 [Mycolicibacterium mucogenicum]